MTLARLVVAPLLVVTACSRTDHREQQTRPGPSATAPLPSAAEPARVFERLVSCRWTGQYAESYGDEVAAFECKSSASKPLTQLQFWVYYYDENGEQLDRFAHSLEQSDQPLISPGETKTFTLGKPKPKEPVHAKKIEVEASRGTYRDGSSWSNPSLAPEERPLGG